MHDATYLFFDETHLAVFRAFAAQVVPADEGDEGAAADAALHLADRVLSERPTADQRLLRTFLTAVQWLPVLRYGRTFTGLSDAQRVRFMGWLERGPVAKFRAGFFGVKTFALLGYFGDPAHFDDIGYPGPRQDAPYYQLRVRDGGSS